MMSHTPRGSQFQCANPLKHLKAVLKDKERFVTRCPLSEASVQQDNHVYQRVKFQFGPINHINNNSHGAE